MSRYYNNRNNRRKHCENYSSESNYLEDDFELDYYDRNRSNRCKDDSSSRRDRCSGDDDSSSSDESSSSEDNSRSDKKNSSNSDRSDTKNSKDGHRSDNKSGKDSNKNDSKSCDKDNKNSKNNNNDSHKPPKPPKPPYHTIDHIRLVNSSDEQTNIGDESSLSFTDVVINSSDFVNFAPNTGNILLKDNGVYFVIYESQIYSTCPQDKIHTLGLHLTLDGIHIEGSGTTVRVGGNQKAELSSHAIITTTKGSPNVLSLLNSSSKIVNAFGANLTIIKLAEMKYDNKDDNNDEKKDDNKDGKKDDSKDEKKDHE